MAQFVMKNKALLKEYNACRKKKNAYYLVCGIFFVSFFVFGVVLLQFALALPLLAGFGIFGAVAGKMSEKENILYSGIKGENDLRDALSALPDTYCGFQNITVTFEGMSSELDMVVVGPTGVFVIENKNLNGTVTGYTEDQHWTQYKVGRQGGTYSKDFYNPVKQVGTHVYRLANHLRGYGYRTYVNAAVYFSNFDATVRIAGDQRKTPVFSAANRGELDLINYIANRDRVLSGEEVIRICSFLDGRTYQQIRQDVN